MSDDVPQTKGREPEDSTLIRYLVGRTSEEETEQLDELSVASEDFAVRLRAVEHDLVDAYVRGELTGDTLEGFRAQYLRTPAGLEAVEFAQALRGYRRAQAAPAAPAVPHASDVRATTRAWPAWLLAAAAVALVTSAFLLFDDMRLRREISGVQETQATLEERTRQLQEELNQQQAAARAANEELARVREGAGGGQTRPGGPLPTLLALVLSPATRGGDQLPQFSVPPGADSVVLRLPLIAVEFTQYEAILRGTNSDRVVWRSGRLPAPPAPSGASSAPSGRERPMIPVTVPTDLLTPRAYTLELTGISARGDAEPLDSYPFRVVP